MARHQRTHLTTYGSGSLDGSRPGDVARMRPLGQARFCHDIVEDHHSEYLDRQEDAAIFNKGSHDEDPCEQFNEQLNQGRLSRGRS